MSKIFKGLATLLFVSCLGLLVIAAKPGGITQLTSLWVGDATQTATTTPAENDLYVYGTGEFDGALRADGGLITTTFTSTAGAVSGTDIANVIREIYFPMAGWVIDGGADIDEATAPELGNADNVPAIIWDNSGEVVAIQQTFRLPSTYVSGLILYCLVSSDTDVGTAGILDWQIWVNNDGVAFDAAAIAQTQVAMGTASDPNVSNEVLTLTLDATGEAALTAGTWVTVDLFNATTHATGNLELKGVQGVYTATQ